MSPIVKPLACEPQPGVRAGRIVAAVSAMAIADANAAGIAGIKPPSVCSGG